MLAPKIIITMYVIDSVVGDEYFTWSVADPVRGYDEVSLDT